MSEVVPIIAPSRAECWRRIRVAESILVHRVLVPEVTRQELLRVLRGEAGGVETGEAG